MSELRCSVCGKSAGNGCSLYGGSEWGNFISSRPRQMVYSGLLLCEDCWDKRQRLHIELDDRFFENADLTQRMV